MDNVLAGRVLEGRYVQISSKADIGHRRKAFVGAYERRNSLNRIFYCDIPGGVENVHLPSSAVRVLPTDEVGTLCKRLRLTPPIVAGDSVGRYVEFYVEAQCRYRKAYITAYDENTRVSTVFFCDREKGHLTLELERYRYRELSPLEVKTLQKRSGFSSEKLLTKGIRKQVTDKNIQGTTSFRTPAERIVGRWISVRSPHNGAQYLALVMGFKLAVGKHGSHLVYCIHNGRSEIVDLSKRDWKLLGSNDQPWKDEGLLGKRIVILWSKEELEEEADMNGNSQVPFEAFVVKLLDDFIYEVVYTVDNTTEEINLRENLDNWETLELDQTSFHGVNLITWSKNSQ